MKIQPGDKVAIYNKNMRTIGKVIRVEDNSVLIGDDVKAEMIWVHEKQCRKLRKNPRRVIWVRKSSMEDQDLYPFWKLVEPEEKEKDKYTRFREWPEVKSKSF